MNQLTQLLRRLSLGAAHLARGARLRSSSADRLRFTTGMHERDFKPLFSGIAPRRRWAVAHEAARDRHRISPGRQRRHDSGSLGEWPSCGCKWRRRDCRKPAASDLSCSTRPISARANSPNKSTIIARLKASWNAASCRSAKWKWRACTSRWPKIRCIPKRGNPRKQAC